jgi:O-succinylbenzoate synthase
MKIDAIEIYHVSMPLISPFRTAYGSDNVIESTLTKLISGNFYGWGEAAPLQTPSYSPEFAESQFIASKRFIAPALHLQDIISGEQLQKRLSWIKGNYFAKAGFDMAWWDLYSRMCGKPLWKVIGGKDPEVESGADFGIMDNIGMLLDCIQKAVDDGYKRVKLKYGPGWETSMVNAVRNKFPDLTIHIDCNSAYTLADINMFKKLDDYNLAMIEQPLMNDDLINHSKLQAHLKTPICLDESITSPTKAQKAIEIKACKWINIKPGRVGGITNAIAINEIARSNGIPCWIGGMLESAIGANHCMALATLPNIKYPCDIFPSSRFYLKDLGYPELIHSSAATFKASDAPGIGVEPVPELLEKFSLQKAMIFQL